MAELPVERNRFVGKDRTVAKCTMVTLDLQYRFFVFARDVDKSTVTTLALDYHFFVFADNGIVRRKTGDLTFRYRQHTRRRRGNGSFSNTSLYAAHIAKYSSFSITPVQRREQ